MSARDILNERMWRHGDLQSMEVVVRHRGAPDDERRVPGIDIVDVGSKGLFIAVKPRADWESEWVDDQEGSTFIPWHRVIEVRSPTEVLWTRTGAR